MSALQRKVLLDGQEVVGNSAHLSTDVTPFSIGRTVVLRIKPNAGFVGTVLLQSSEDDSVFAPAATEAFVATDGARDVSVKLDKQFVRARVSVVSAGNVDVSLEA